jgi:hypothetical protein
VTVIFGTPHGLRKVHTECFQVDGTESPSHSSPYFRLIIIFYLFLPEINDHRKTFARAVHIEVNASPNFAYVYFRANIRAIFLI